MMAFLQVNLSYQPLKFTIILILKYVCISILIFTVHQYCFLFSRNAAAYNVKASNIFGIELKHTAIQNNAKATYGQDLCI